MSILSQLPPAPAGKTGWPWTEETSSAIYDKNVQYPKISIVTPAYNQGQYIEETIRSLLLQNYPNLEYIIIDGGSNDDTLEIIKKYEPWLTYWVSEKDKGQSNAINKGIEKCTGEWFNWLNSDDYLLPDALFHLSQKIPDPSAGITVVSGNALQKKLNGSIAKMPDRDTLNPGYDDFIGIGYYQPAALFLLNKLKMFGGINEARHYTMDIEIMILLTLTGKRNATDENIIVTRLHEESKSVKANKEFYTDWINSYALLLNYFPKEYRNSNLIEQFEKVTGVDFKYKKQNFEPTRFTQEEYQTAQLHIAGKNHQLIICLW